MMQQIINPSHIRWGCRRGMLELDLLLLPFFDKRFNQLSAAQQQTFVRLLDYPDPEIYSWLMGHAQPEDPLFQELVSMIKDHAITAS